MNWRRKRCAWIPAAEIFTYVSKAGPTSRWGGIRRYQEAIPILQRCLAAYPNVGSHYALAVDYIELGREPQARAQAAEILRMSPNFSVDTFVQGFPNQDEAYKERVRTDLRKAGLK